MIGRQQDASEPARFYAYCAFKGCGICGPIRTEREDARADEAAHREVCSARRTYETTGVSAGKDGRGAPVV